MPRRRWTNDPTGFITAAATSSLDTAASGETPKKRTRIGHQGTAAHAGQPDDYADAEGGGDEERVERHDASHPGFGDGSA